MWDKILTPQLNTDLGSLFNGFFVELWPSLAVEFWSRCWILTPSWVAIPRVEEYVDGSEFHVEWKPRSNFTLNYDPGSEFNVELRPGVLLQRRIKTRDHNSTLNYDPGSHFEVEFWPGSKFHVELRPGSEFHIKLWSLSRSQYNVESWLGVKIQRGINT